MKYFFFFLLLISAYSCKPKQGVNENDPAISAEQKQQLEKKRLTYLYKNNFNSLLDFAEGLAIFETDSSCGAIDTSGNIVFSVKNADLLSSFSNGYAVVTYSGDDRHHAYLDKKGNVVFDAAANGITYIDIFDSFGHAVFKDKNGKYGLLNRQFRVMIKPVYKSVLVVGRNKFRVIQDDKATLIDSLGNNRLAGLQFDLIETYTTDNKMFCMSNDGIWGIYDSAGKLLHTYDASELIYISGLAAISKMGDQKNYVWALADTAGKMVVPYGKYSDCSSAVNGLAMVYNEEKLHFSTDEFQKKLGYVDVSGREVIPLQYEDGYSFLDGIALVKKGGRWGYIDTTGKTILDFKYENASQFNNGYATVMYQGREMIIDKNGKELTIK